MLKTFENQVVCFINKTISGSIMFFADMDLFENMN